jgi:adenylate kinase
LRAAVKEGTPTGKRVAAIMAHGQLVPDEVVNDLVSEFFHSANPPKCFVLDGYPRNGEQAEFLDRDLKECGLGLTRVILFNVPEEELIRRMTSRRLTDRRDDDDDATVRKRLKLYHDTTAPIAEYYRKAGLLVEIDADGDVEAIHKQIVALTI